MRRCIHTITKSPNFLSINWPSARPSSSTFSYKWLRDQCQCSSCLHSSTRQKLFSSGDITTLPLAPTFTNLNHESKTLHLGWPEGSLSNDSKVHESTWDLKWLYENSYNPPTKYPLHKSHLTHVRLWDSDMLRLNTNNAVKYPDLMDSSSAGLRDALDQIKQYGICFIRNVPADQCEQIAGRFGELRDTFYGRTWDVKSVIDAKNVAYTSLSLGLHMDLMYFEAPPGLQFLHSLKNTVKGGESIFADSFKAVEYFKALYPTEFRLLCEQPITFQYINDSHNMHYIRPIIEISDPNEPLRVNYSPPFQGPILFNAGVDEDTFYRAFSLFEGVLHMDGMIYETRLEAGDCVVFSNRRVLHGRRAFNREDGERHFKGCYVDWDSFKDKERIYGKQ